MQDNPDNFLITGLYTGQHRFQWRLHPVFEPISSRKRYPMKFVFYAGIPQRAPFTFYFVSWILSFKRQRNISSECYNYLRTLLAAFAFFHFCPVFPLSFQPAMIALPFFVLENQGLLQNLFMWGIDYWSHFPMSCKLG